MSHLHRQQHLHSLYPELAQKWAGNEARLFCLLPQSYRPMMPAEFAAGTKGSFSKAQQVAATAHCCQR